MQVPRRRDAVGSALRALTRRIANFTDFAPLESEPDVRVAHAGSPHDVDGALLVIRPGSRGLGLA
jgi:cobyric acid synthase